MQATLEGALSTTVEAASSGGKWSASTAVLDSALLRPGDMVGRFQVRRLLAQGGMGRVYLARDTTLGRSVALKLVRPDRADEARADEFIQEARITAQLNHPHIVQLHDVGRFGAFAYLALEYLEGESLKDRIARGAPSTDESLRVLRAIADALRHAHAEGVIHCDLKPANVMLPLDGRVRVVDFGLATARTNPAGELVAGTPDWMAPEQWRGEPACDRTDIWAFAVLTHELLTGAHPFGPASMLDVRRLQVLDGALCLRPLDAPGVTDQIRANLLLSLAQHPRTRPTARDWFLALDDALTGGASATGAEAPFRGLAAFEERHAALFFGREGDVDAFMERLRERTSVPIVGPSGVGKSSFLLAGVIPRLRARGGWTIIVVRPGAHPFAAIAHRLLAAVEDSPAPAATAALAEALLETPSLLAVRLATIAAVQGGQILLAIDQLEEVFTQGSSARDIERFLEMLAVLDDPTEPVRITYTLRDDFLGRVPGVRDLFVVRRLGTADVRRTITAPLERLGYRFENPAIIDDMLAETGHALVDLPLVQFACRALWDARDQDQRLLLTSVYHRLGGVTGALAGHADQIVNAMTADEQRISRELLGRLVVGNHARRIVERDDLLDRLPAGAAAVLDRLVSARLLAQHRPAGADTFSVELAHESLLVNWTQLRHWLDESGEERRLLQQLDDAATIWERLGAGAEGIWTEDKLGAARVRASDLRLSVPPRIERFLAAGEAHHRRRRIRARWRRGIIVVTALAIAAAALIIANRFRDQKLEAQAQASALRSANDDIGRFKLVIHPFDWGDGKPVPVDPALLPDLRISLYQAASGDPDLPGREVAPGLVRIATTTPGTFLIEAPGGPAYLRIDGRGRVGDVCAASWLRITSLPGYARRDYVKRIAITIPSCSASRADTVPVPAGDFIYGGPGVPATAFPDYIQPERIVHLNGFRIDRTELSNARFAPAAALASVTGYPVPRYPSENILPGASLPGAPITSIDAFHAEALCRYYGGRLPTDEEWTKSARGGLVIDGIPNPEPRRLYPWSGGPRSCANVEGEEDGFPRIAPVDSLHCGASPYAALNLAGNVQEWVAREGQIGASDLRVVRGGGADSPAEREHATTIFRNSRDARQFSFTLGARCLTDDDIQKGSVWNTH